MAKDGVRHAAGAHAPHVGHKPQTQPEQGRLLQRRIGDPVSPDGGE